MLVGEAVRGCLADGEGRLLVAVYVQPDGKVIRAFVSGAKGPVVKCVREKLPGMMLPIRLPKPDYVEWRLRIGPESVKARVVRPPGLR